MRSSVVCTSIEAEKMELQCRKFFAHCPRKDSKLGKTIFPFKLSIHGFARVKEAYPTGRCLYRVESHSNADDEIHGEALDGFSIKPLGKERIQNATSTHKATFVQCRGGVYVHVEIGVRDQLAER